MKKIYVKSIIAGIFVVIGTIFIVLASRSIQNSVSDTMSSKEIAFILIGTSSALIGMFTFFFVLKELLLGSKK